MPGRMHLLGYMRHRGRPTSGRYVYRAKGGGWYWQCDLHDDAEAQPDQYGSIMATQREAFDGAVAHAGVCSERFRDQHTHDSRESRDACRGGHCDLATIVLIDGRPASTDPTVRAYFSRDDDKVARIAARHGCAEPGPWRTVCTLDVGHPYSHYDAQDDSSWQDDWHENAPEPDDDDRSGDA